MILKPRLALDFYTREYIIVLESKGHSTEKSVTKEESIMPRKVSVVMALLGVMLAIMQLVTTSIVKNQAAQIREYDLQVKDLTAHARTAMLLLQAGEWYIVDPLTVSSEPDGKGKIVKLNSQLRAQGDRLNVKHPDCGRKVLFSPNERVSSAYVVEGGLLHYELK